MLVTADAKPTSVVYPRRGDVERRREFGDVVGDSYGVRLNSAGDLGLTGVVGSDGVWKPVSDWGRVNSGTPACSGRRPWEKSRLSKD